MPGPSGNSASSTMDDGEKARSIRNKRKHVSSVLLSINTYCYFYTSGKRKCHDDNLELFHLLSEMDEAAEKRQAEFETKQLKLLADLQQTSRQKEHEHEESHGYDDVDDAADHGLVSWTTTSAIEPISWTNATWSIFSQYNVPVPILLPTI